MAYQIEGITKEQYDGFGEGAQEARDFPFETGKWLNYTAEVRSVHIKADSSGSGSDRLVVSVANGNCFAQVYAQLNVMAVGGSCADPVAAIKRNTAKLLRILKALGIARFTNGSPEILEDLFPQAVGRIVAIGVLGVTDESGRQRHNARGCPVTAISFGGAAKQLVPVVEPESCGGPQATPETGGSAPEDDFGFEAAS
jgi:hypothetical protein